MNQDLYNHGILDEPSALNPVNIWTRPSEWLTLPAITNTENKVVILRSISPAGDGLQNYAAIYATTNTGDWVVDWGDGTSSTGLAAGQTLYKQYNFASIDPATTMSNGSRQVIITVTTTTGNFNSINFNQRHTSLNSSLSTNAANTEYLELKMSAPQLTTITIGNTSTTAFVTHNSLENIEILSHNCNTIALGYMSGLKKFFVAKRLTGSMNGASMFQYCYGLTYVHTDWLDGNVFSPHSEMFRNCLALFKCEGEFSASFNHSGMFRDCQMLDVFPKITNPYLNSINGSSMFLNCYSMKYIPDIPYSNVNNSSFMFSNCVSLRYIHDLNMPNVTDPSNMFESCVGLKKVGRLTFSNSMTSISSLFSGCSNLETFAGFTNSTANVNNAFSAFFNCRNLVNIPSSFTFGASCNCSSMFTNCAQLTSAPEISTFITSSNNMFANCYNLETVPSYNYSIGISTMSSMFSSCRKLKSVGDITLTPNVNVNLSSLFLDCECLEKAPTITFTNDQSASNIAGIFTRARRLSYTPPIKSAGVTATSGSSNIALNIGSLKSIELPGIRFGFNVSNNQLSRTALVALFNSLGTASGAQTLTISGNTGVADLTAEDRAIATGKGWTLSG